LIAKEHNRGLVLSDDEDEKGEDDELLDIGDGADGETVEVEEVKGA
jgi:hypothetical protein